MIAKVNSVAPMGFGGEIIEVETDSKAGLPLISIVGMGNKAITEAKERVRSAITNSLLDFPARKLIINLAPAVLPKDGTYLDLAIALSILVASGQLKQTEVDGAIFAGELALDGSIRPVRGIINIVEKARDQGYSRVYVPEDNQNQASLITGITIVGISSLQEVFLILKGESKPRSRLADRNSEKSTAVNPVDINDIMGQEVAKRAVLISAVGRHNLLMTGPPGVGKSLLAKSILGLLPTLEPHEALETTKLHSLAGISDQTTVNVRPFRSPHHTISLAALVGGGKPVRPGEISLAHNGVLFLDELPEFARSHLEAMRQPLEDKQVSIIRTNSVVTYPADFTLVATMNPCKCGYYDHPDKQCVCTPGQIANYRARVSGPLLDRFDMRVNVSAMPNELLFSSKSLNNKQRFTDESVNKLAILRQKERYKRDNYYNGNSPFQLFDATIELSNSGKKLLQTASEKLGLSTRSVHKLLRVALTISDLNDSPKVDAAHIAEALQFRTD